MATVFPKYYPSTNIFFKYFDEHPYVAFNDQEIRIPINAELKGLDALIFTNKDDFIVKVDEAHNELTLSDIIDGGEF